MKYPILLLAFMSMPTHPMGTFKYKFTTFCKKPLLHKLTAAGYWTLLCYPAWLNARTKYMFSDYPISKSYANLDPQFSITNSNTKLDPQITNLVRADLQAIGLTDPVKIYATYCDDDFPVVGKGIYKSDTNGKCIDVVLNIKGETAQLLAQHTQLQALGKIEEAEKVKAQLAPLRSTVQHEGVRILHKDIKREAMAEAFTPVIGHAVYKGLNKLLLSPTTVPLKRNIVKPLCFATAYIAMKGTLYQYERYHTLKADDTIHPTLLNGALDLQRDYKKNFNDNVRAACPNTTSLRVKFYEQLLYEKPLPQARINRFESRLRKLEGNEQAQ